jgi:hypothetical protein
MLEEDALAGLNLFNPIQLAQRGGFASPIAIKPREYAALGERWHAFLGPRQADGRFAFEVSSAWTKFDGWKNKGWEPTG